MFKSRLIFAAQVAQYAMFSWVLLMLVYEMTMTTLDFIVHDGWCADYVLLIVVELLVSAVALSAVYLGSCGLIKAYRSINA